MDPHIWLALITLTSIEIVLGIDNIIFIAMAFSVFVEMLNLKVRSRQLAPVRLRRSTPEKSQKK